MKRTTIMLPDDLDARLRLEARSQGVSLAEMARQILEQGLAEPLRPRRRKLSFIGAGESDTAGDLGDRADEYLAEIYDERRRRRQRAWREAQANAPTSTR